jgi:superfamily I DNA/RNA helicase
MRMNSLQDLITKLTEYKFKEIAKLHAAEKNTQAQSLEDKVDTILALTDGIDTIVELEDRIETIFSDDVVGVVFSSVHRAKGLEAEKVFLLHPELMPHKMAKKDWEMEQERNIEYVALTRTLSELIYVS